MERYFISVGRITNDCFNCRINRWSIWYPGIIRREGSFEYLSSETL